MTCGARWDLEHKRRLTLSLAERLLEDLASCPEWDGFCACHPNAVREFEAISGALKTLSESGVQSGDLERAAELLRQAAALRVRCEELVGNQNSP